jgi:hypothetical protein
MFDLERSSDSLRFGRYRGFDGTHQIAGRVERDRDSPVSYSEALRRGLARMDHDGIVAAVATRQEQAARHAEMLGRCVALAL